MGTLVVRRPVDTAGIFRHLKVFVDGREVGGLRPKQNLSLELPDGWHSVRGAMDWVTCRPLDVLVSANQAACVELSLPFTSIYKPFIWRSRGVKARLVPCEPADDPIPQQ